MYVPFSISIFLQFYHFRVERNRRQENGDDIIQVMGLRLEVHEKDAEFDENGVPEVLAGVDHIIRIFGKISWIAWWLPSQIGKVIRKGRVSFRRTVLNSR